MAQQPYFIYSTHRTREAACDALEEYFAEGLISEGERPRIDYRIDYNHRKRPWMVMFPG